MNDLKPESRTRDECLDLKLETRTRDTNIAARGVSVVGYAPAIASGNTYRGTYSIVSTRRLPLLVLACSCCEILPDSPIPTNFEYVPQAFTGEWEFVRVVEGIPLLSFYLGVSHRNPSFLLMCVTL